MFKSKSFLKKVKTKESDSEKCKCGHVSSQKREPGGKKEDMSPKKLGFLKTVVGRVKSNGSGASDQYYAQHKKSLQRSLAELKLDLPRVQNINGTTISESSASSSSKNAEKIQNLPRVRSPSRQLILKQRGLQNQPFRRNYAHGRERSRNHLRATVSHKIDAGNRRETVYTEWDNHHPATGAAGDPLEGPRSLQGVPRAPIPTPDALTDRGCPGASASAERGGHYQTLNDRDGDYSYAYDSSLSPAFIIKYNQEEGEDEGEVGGDLPKGSKVENIYEEIGDERESSSRGSNGSDSGIGGLDAAKGAASKFSQGTLDVSPKKKVTKRKEEERPSDEKLGALDRLLFQTAPGMTATQRRDLRKSLVDEVFEELVKRHHDRVLDQLKLDVEDFINPDAEREPKEDEIGSRRSTNRKSAKKLKKCESMDLKEAMSTGSSSSYGSFKRRKSFKRKGPSVADREAEKATKDPPPQKLFSKSTFLSNAKRYSEVFNRKYFGRHKNGETEEPERRLSALLSVSTNSFDLLDKATLNAKRPSTYKKTATELDDDLDNGDNDRRLRRSEIIQSFLEQSAGSDTECNNNEETACTHIWSAIFSIKCHLLPTIQTVPWTVASYSIQRCDSSINLYNCDT